MFAVFGVTHQHAKKVTEKKTPRTVKVKKKSVTRTDAEYAAAVQKAADEQFEKMKPLILSPEYSSPSIAEEFMAMAKKIGAVRLEVRIKAPVKKTIKGKEKVVRRWVKWESAKDYEAA